MSMRKTTPAVIFGIGALGLACTTFSVIGRELPGNEGNVTKMRKDRQVLHRI